MQRNMNKYRIENPNSNNELDCKSSSTLRTNPSRRVNDKGYTKHYFEEGKRICSKIGSGGFHHTLSLSTPIEGDYKDIHDHRSIGGVIKIFDMCMGLEPRIKNEDIHGKVIKPYSGQVNTDEPVFYYHSDHLGSASYITDDQGYKTQHLVYLPFGELRSNREYHNNNKYDEQHWVDWKYNTSQFDTPYKFNGKEEDQETGYNYFGARYLNPTLSIWLSVDPMSDKYPHLTSYNYCANNPVMLIDPHGKDVELSATAQATHEKYYKKNEDYTALYDKLNDDHSVLFKVSDKEDNARAKSEGADGGALLNFYPTENDTRDYGSYTNGMFNVEWGTPSDAFGGDSEHVLLEELFHAGQLIDANYNLGATVTNEVDAKEFSIRVNPNSISKTYSANGFSGFPTQLGVIKGFDRNTSIDFLKNGRKNIPVKDYYGNTSHANLSGAYSDLPIK